MISWGLGLWMVSTRMAAAESACDSGCEPGRDWIVSPQLEGAVLPTNTRLYVFDGGTLALLDGTGAEVEISTTAAPEDGVWIAPVAGWTAGATYTLVAGDGSRSDLVIGSTADAVAPTLSGVNTRTRDFSTCDATIPLFGIDPVDLSDDQTGANQLFAEVRVTGASDSDARMIDPWGKEMTAEDADPCFPNLPGAHAGETVTLELRFYDLAGNVTDAVTAGPVELVVDDPAESGGGSGGGGPDVYTEDKTCGCAAGGAAPAPFGLLAALLLLRRPRRGR